MVHYSGWMCIFDHSASKEIEFFFKRVTSPSLLVSGKWINGQFLFNISGSNNHFNNLQEKVMNSYEIVAKMDEEAFGLLFIRNDELEKYSNSYLVWKLARGMLTQHEDNLLSPCYPTIEGSF